LIRFYKGDWNGEILPVQDDSLVVEFIQSKWEHNETKTTVEAVLSQSELWGQDLSKISNLSSKLTEIIDSFDSIGIEETYKIQLETNINE